jgi:hypothetical protein
MSLMGDPYMWSFTMTGREARRSNRDTSPLLVPTAHCSPLSSNLSDVRPSPACAHYTNTLFPSPPTCSLATSSHWTETAGRAVTGRIELPGHSLRVRAWIAARGRTAPAADAASRAPADLRWRRSKHSRRPSSPAAAKRPCAGHTAHAFTAGDCDGSGA